ncbi:MAG: YqeG family HAD IIIA-type phosphatase [Fimbriimonas sp.]
MNTFRTGEFDRTRLHRAVVPFCPASSAHSLGAINLDDLWNQGKRLLLLDVDNTLTNWHSEEVPRAVIEWVDSAKAKGFDICIISNTRRHERLRRLAESLGVTIVRGRMKPSRTMFRLALIRFKRSADEAVMIGDQLLTDVFGANRSGIDAIWVLAMDKKEFGGTKISRMVERMLKGPLYRALVSPVDEPIVADPTAGGSFWERPIIRQIIKFGIVGGSSLVIDLGIRTILLYKLAVGGVLVRESLGNNILRSAPSLGNFFRTPFEVIFPIAATLGASVAILNSFVWNRMWTFQIRGKEERLAQLKRFVLISVIGLVLNVLFSTFFNHLIPGESQASATAATFMAAALVAIWNFTGQRFWAFRATK